jgi:hypothetical protein
VDVELLYGERQKRETERAVIACNDWLLMGPGRSLRKLWETYTKINTGQQIQPPTRSYTTLRTWASRYDWPTRARLYDAEQERLKAEQAQAEIAEMNVRQARNALGLQTAGAQLVMALLRKTKQAPQLLEELGVEKLARLLPQAARAIEVGGREERQARGQPGDRLDLTSGGKSLAIEEVIVEIPGGAKDAVED